ncbi:uncharacterized protein N7511_003733 [Penicillium nucicola]|uniref:uncharacterized protein n=1 Tax=Penicillium nucicola TaxID=1850975 RepID=UPI00254510C6|nr:uncharacterized protein N7511_003733 [Penicillium nucicola]KAJ5766117.1 hypothetical protein N7511_003733 [Penicillium nucicola]
MSDFTLLVIYTPLPFTVFDDPALLSLILQSSTSYSTMSSSSYSQKVLSKGSQLVSAGLEGAKGTVAYGMPVLEKTANFTAQTVSWGIENPVLFTCATVGTTGALVFAAPALVSAPVLSTMGFTASGIKAGSMAAAAHSSIGNIAAGSAMAIGQSAGAGGSGLAIVNGAAQMGGAAMAVGSAGFAWLKAKL